VTGVRRIPYRVVDAFTDRPFGGNPAAVILPSDLAAGGLDEGELGDATLQRIATELNLSETAFPGPLRPEGTRQLRWFTPATEVSLCGHATLAAAHALLEAGGAVPFRFDSRSGVLQVHPAALPGAGEALLLDFPADPPVEGPPPAGLVAALGLDGDAAPGVRYASGARCALLELPGASATRLHQLSPDFRALVQVALPEGVMGVSVTVRTDDDPAARFESRFFGPWVGVEEDPVTGMAHCLLGPWWSARLGTDEMTARQGGRRRGHLRVRVRGDRVHLVGQAFTVAEGHLLLDPDREPERG
jgi:PhzF family phenazine biosynthesis protein